MRLRFAFLVCLLLCGSAFYSAVSGLLFIPLVPAIERVASQAASCDVSIGRVRVLGKAGVAFDTVVVGPTKAPWLRISTVRVRPKWGDLINRKIALARVTLVEPIAAWDGTPLPLPSAEPGADRFAALALINQLTIVRGRWSSPLTPAITAIDLQSSFLNHTVTMDHLSFETEKGVLRGSGQIALNSGEFNFRSDLQEFRLDRWLAKSVTLPAELTFAFTGKAQVQGTLPQWALQTEGVLIQGYAGDGTPSPLTINVHFDGPKGKIQTEVKGPLLNGSAHMQVNIDRRWVEGRFSLAVSSITRLAPFWPELEKTAGTVAVQGSVKGLWSSPDFSVLGIGKNLRYNAMAAEFLRADIERQGALPRPLALDLAVSSMAWSSAGEDKQVISNAHITWTGDMSEGVLGTNIRSNLISMEAHGPARRKGNGFHWQWDRLKILPVQSPEWRAVPGGELIVRGTESVEIKHLQFGDSNSFFNVRSLAWKNGSLTIDAIAADFPLHFPPAFSGNVSGHLQWMGPLENPGGDFNVSLSSAAIRQSPPLDASVRGTVGESMVTFTEVSFGSAGFPPLHGQGSIPWAWIIQKESGHAMDFSLQAGPLDPAVLFKSFPSMDVQPGGIFRFGARLQGKKSALKAQGTVEARLPGLKIASWGIDAQDARVHLELLNDHFRIREAAVKLGKGSLRLSGESRWPALQWELHGTQLALKLRRQWDFKTDLHLALGGTWTEPTLSGLVSLKEATYEAARKKKGEPDRDTQSVVLPFWERLLLNVQTEWENNVWYRDGLTKIETQGHLLVTKQRGRRAIALSGPLTLLRGVTMPTVETLF